MPHGGWLALSSSTAQGGHWPSGLAGCDRVQPPLPRHALQFRQAAVFERDPGPSDQVFDGLGHEHLTGRRPGRHPGADGDCDARHLAIEHLAFARVQAQAHLQADLAHHAAYLAALPDHPACGDMIPKFTAMSGKAMGVEHAVLFRAHDLQAPPEFFTEAMQD
jgi:hypothetical protein